jgi:hypothetical protein
MLLPQVKPFGMRYDDIAIKAITWKCMMNMTWRRW